MEIITPHGLEINLSIQEDKNTKSKVQKKTIFHYLKVHSVTTSMVTDATAVSICRYKKDLVKQGLLFEVEKKICKLTGFKAWYLTTNSDLFPQFNHKKLGNG
ncbi:hypothetical protein [Flavobacterium gilvum]|uniref:Uncharacterized protein n=1 Tax=Flavobacterium gilvum TaxID=1492737 RepID=A0AAC9I4W8_9FLAO|nr:hypothetical protein [Flavobacterium gilvum]AOW10489.1 hypothetical protein EM308_13805 [Flavobacterium gilvum]KFC61131.1 hypothetical protein FEM08_00670 [Flavobacterium gilvum]